MRRAGRWMTVAVLAASGPAPLQAAEDEPFCIALRRIVAAAGERPPFASIAGDEGELLPGFGLSCAALDDGLGRRVACFANPYDIEAWAGLAAQTARCRADATRLDEAPGVRRARFRAGSATIQIRQLGIPAGVSGIGLSYAIFPAGAD